MKEPIYEMWDKRWIRGGMYEVPVKEDHQNRKIADRIGEKLWKTIHARWYERLESPVKEELKRVLKLAPNSFFGITAVTTNTRPRWDFSLCWNLSFRRLQSTVSMVFSCALTEKVPSSSLNELTRIISNDDGVFNVIISLRWRITLLKQRGLCEISEIAVTLSTVYVKVLRLLIYLIVWYENTGAVDDELQRMEYKFKETKDITLTTQKVSSE